MLSGLEYPEPGSNRHGLLHWCLRPARLPIPPSGLNDLVDSEIDCKGTAFFLIDQIFFEKKVKNIYNGVIFYEKHLIPL